MGLQLSAQTTTYTITKTISPSSTAILTYDIVWYTDSRYSSSDYNLLWLTDKICFQVKNKNLSSSYVSINETNKTFTPTATTTYVDDKHTINHVILDIHLVVNTLDGTISAFSIKDVNNSNSTLVALENLTVTSVPGTTDYSSISLSTYSHNKNEVNSYLKSIKVQEETQDVATYSYTVNYTNGGNTVKSVSGSLTEGADIPVLSAVDGEGDYAGNHYLISAAEVPSWTISTTESNNVKEVPVRAPYSTTVNVYYVVDGVKDAEPTRSPSFTETDSKVANWTYCFPYYIQRDSKWYKATLKGEDEDKFGETGTFSTTGGSMDKEVEYSLDETVVYYSEQGDYGTDVSYSNGSTNTYWKTQAIGSLDAGTYEMTAMQESGYTCTLYNGWVSTDNKGDELITFNNSNRTDQFTLAENTTSLRLHNGNNARMDYILIREITSVNIASVDALGYTFSSTLPLDFTGTTVEAYTAAYNSTTEKVDLTRVYKVPANTGLFIKGTAADIPVLTGDADVIGTNNLVAVSSTTTVNQTDGGTNTNFVLGVDNAAAPTAAVFLKAPLAGVSVGAGKAYLQIPTANVPTSRLAVVFNDETTGVSEELRVKSEVFATAPAYSLQGQRVAQPKKGLYIMNGKKIIVK